VSRRHSTPAERLAELLAAAIVKDVRGRLADERPAERSTHEDQAPLAERSGGP
jgi:hypothetical protein